MKQHVTTWILAGSLMAASLSGCSSLMGGQTIATVDGTKISQGDFNSTFDRSLKMMNLNPQDMNKDQYKPMAQMFKRMTLQGLILDTMVANEAKKRNITVDSQEIKRYMDAHIAQSGGQTQFEEQLKRMGLSQSAFEKELEKQLVKDKVALAIAGGSQAVSEKDVRAFFNAHVGNFKQPEQVRARHILVAASAQQIEQDFSGLNNGKSPAEIKQKVAKVMAEKRDKAQKLLADVQADPKSFEKLAKQNSDDKASGQNGGDLGYFSQAAMVPSFAQAAFSAKPGTIVNHVVESPFGYHIIQVLDRRPPKTFAFTEVKPQIKAMLENQQKMAAMERWVGEQKKKIKIDVAPDYKALQDGPPPSAVPAPGRS